MHEADMRRTYMFAFILLICSQLTYAKDTAGWIEYAYIMPESFIMQAKLDTGADTTSISASDVAMFSRHGQTWARFTVQNFRRDTLVLERPVVRTVLIKAHSGEKNRRPVIELALCIGGIVKITQANLVDRSRYKYELLVGRNFMSDSLVVDPALKHMLPDNCTHDLTTDGS